jgi:hypothetical protein
MIFFFIKSIINPVIKYFSNISRPPYTSIKYKSQTNRYQNNIKGPNKKNFDKDAQIN